MDATIVDEAGTVTPEMWRWFRKALAEGRINESAVELSEAEKANNPREKWRLVMIEKARDEVEDLRWHLWGKQE